MGTWYTIGILVGLGAAIGVVTAALAARAIVAAIAAAIVAGVIGIAFGQWDEAAGGVVGGALGAIGAIPVIAGTLRRGGTRGGTATLVSLAGLVFAALAFVPVVGYLEALALPALGLRMRRRAPERHAGLRSLAKD